MLIHLPVKVLFFHINNINLIQVFNKAIVPLVRTVMDNFVTDRASAEAITVGLNTIREICSRCPYAVDEDLLADLIGYKSYRNKNVVAAARSLLRLYRRVNFYLKLLFIYIVLLAQLYGLFAYPFLLFRFVTFKSVKCHWFDEFLGSL